MSGKHLQSLDGLRGLAVLLVVFYHVFPHRDTGILGILSSASWCGVDLFFVLSGFLITGILFDAQGAPAYFRNFYMRRTLRLFPVYIVFILFILLFPHPSNGYPWWINLLYLAYASNLVFFTFPDFQFGMPLVTGHIWSLAVEEQFYLLWPWLVTRLKTRRNILLACLSGSLFALALRLILSHTLHRSLWFLYLELPTRADALLLGGAAAMLYRQPGFVTTHLNKIRLAGAFSALTYLAMCLHTHTFFFVSSPIFTWGYALLALAAISLLLIALPPGSWSGRVLSHRFLRFYGRYSYGLYLFHQLPEQYDYLYVQPSSPATSTPSGWPAILHFMAAVALATPPSPSSASASSSSPSSTSKKRFPDRPRPQPAT